MEVLINVLVCYDKKVLNMIVKFIRDNRVDHYMIYFNNTDSNSDAFVDAQRLIRKFNKFNLISG